MSDEIQFVKIRVPPGEFVEFVSAFLAGVRAGEDFELELGDEVCRFPGDVLERSALDLEFERTTAKSELEITVEWRYDTGDGDA